MADATNVFNTDIIFYLENSNSMNAKEEFKKKLNSDCPGREAGKMHYFLEQTDGYWKCKFCDIRCKYLPEHCQFEYREKDNG